MHLPKLTLVWPQSIMVKRKTFKEFQTSWRTMDKRVIKGSKNRVSEASNGTFSSFYTSGYNYYRSLSALFSIIIY